MNFLLKQAALQHREASVDEETGEPAGVPTGAGVQENAELVEVEAFLTVHSVQVLLHADGQLEVVFDDFAEDLYLDDATLVDIAAQCYEGIEVLVLLVPWLVHLHVLVNVQHLDQCVRVDLLDVLLLEFLFDSFDLGLCHVDADRYGVRAYC